jgi:DNA polymerase-3 subunit gamma/tau
VGQEAIATTLSHALRRQKIAPAYLFTGPRGTGKTSSARIFAKSLNCMASEVPTAQPCGQCHACQSIALGNSLDTIEIDAASNTGVDNIREIIERAQYAPVQCRYKVYTIDECHMLSTAAFNSLLKTLEEPPPHVVFILATTDPQRVLPTIISRCQRFDYRRIPLTSMVQHLTYIAQQEQMQIAPSAIQLIAQIAQGGLRDAESLLDQLSLIGTEVTVEQVWDLVGAVPEEDLLAIVQALQQQKLENLIDRCRQLMERGKEPLMILQNLAGFYRDLSIAKTIPHRQDLTNLTAEIWPTVCEVAKSITLADILAGQHHLKSSEHQLKGSTQPYLWLEVTILGLLPNQIGQPSTANSPVLLPAVVTASVGKSPPTKPPTTIAPVEITAPTLPAVDLEETWQQLLGQLLPSGKGLFAPHGRLLAVEGEVATIGMKSSTFMKLAEGQKQHLQKALTHILGRPMTVLFKLGNTLPDNIPENKDNPPPIAPPPQDEISVEPEPDRMAATPEIVANIERSEPIIPDLAPVQPPVINTIVSEQPVLFQAALDSPAQLTNTKDSADSTAPSIDFPLTSNGNPELTLPSFTDLDLDEAAARLARQFGGEIVAEYVTIWDF